MPSTPSVSCTKAPNFVMLVTGPSITVPGANFCSAPSPGIAQRLLQAERDAAFRRVHSEDDGFYGLAHLHHVGRSSHSFGPRHFGNMNQAFDAGLEFHKRAEIGEPGNGAAHALARLVFFGDGVPRMRLQLLHADRNALLVRVDLDDLGFDLLARRKARRTAC